MSPVKAVAWSVLAYVALAAVVRADTLTVNSGGSSWTIYVDPNSNLAGFYGQSGAPQTVSTPPAKADAVINFGSTGVYPEAAELTTGTASPWYTSPAVTQAYGHTPTAAEQSAFTSAVLADVKQTFALDNLTPTISLDPNATTGHTISVASGLSYASNANAIGITDVGNSGFSFIDKLNYATNPTDLEWAVAHNIAHELMHAFGIGFHPDQTGAYIDAASASWALLTNPATTFSPQAAALIASTGFGSTPLPSSSQVGAQTLPGHPDGDEEILAVPEPASLGAWGVLAAGFLVAHRRRSGRRPAAA